MEKQNNKTEDDPYNKPLSLIIEKGNQNDNKTDISRYNTISEIPRTSFYR